MPEKKAASYPMLSVKTDTDDNIFCFDSMGLWLKGEGFT